MKSFLSISQQEVDKKKIISLLDYTSLKDTDDEISIKKLCQSATTPLGSVAAVCVFPQFVQYAKTLLQTSNISVATVVNFPKGDCNIAMVKKQIQIAIDTGADEIDLVIPYQDYIQSKKSSQTILLIQEAKNICQNKCLKVILETGELKKKELILAASNDAIFAGANFVKTSTGKTDVGATKEAAEIILQSIRASKKKVGLKISGGVRELIQAKEYLALAEKICGLDFIHSSTFRIGASSLLDSLLTANDEKNNF